MNADRYEFLLDELIMRKNKLLKVKLEHNGHLPGYIQNLCCNSEQDTLWVLVFQDALNRLHSYNVTNQLQSKKNKRQGGSAPCRLYLTPDGPKAFLCTQKPTHLLLDTH